VGKNRRLDREPEYNRKRRTGGGTQHLEKCTACGYPIPELIDVAVGAQIPCSVYHVRCVRCQWPVDRRHIAPDGTCVMCMSIYDRKRYYRRTQKEDGVQYPPQAPFGQPIPSVDNDPRHPKNRQHDRGETQQPTVNDAATEETQTCHNGSHISHLVE